MAFAIMGTIAGIGAGISAVSGIAKGISGISEKKKAKKENEKAKQKMQEDLDRYMSLDTSNPYMNMENTMEDLTVNRQAAEFEAQQNQQATANTLSGLNQAAGGSGVAALAQALANQGQLASQKAAVSIAEQEVQNQMAERKEASNIQNLEREGEIQSRNMQKGLSEMALSMSQADVAASNQAVQNANEMIWSGVGDIGSAATSLIPLVGKNK